MKEFQQKMKFKNFGSSDETKSKQCIVCIITTLLYSMSTTVSL